MCLYIRCTHTCSLLPPSFPFFPSPASPLYPFSHWLWLLSRLMSGWTLCFWERCLRKGCPSHPGTSSPSDDTQPLAVWCCHCGSWRRHHATAVLKMEISGSFTVEMAATPCLGFMKWRETDKCWPGARARRNLFHSFHHFRTGDGWVW